MVDPHKLDRSRRRFRGGRDGRGGRGGRGKGDRDDDDKNPEDDWREGDCKTEEGKYYYYQRNIQTGGLEWVEDEEKCDFDISTMTNSQNPDSRYIVEKWLEGDEGVPYNEKYGVYVEKNGNGRTTYKRRWLDYNVMDTDYENYAVVYGCDTWMWGLYHTEVAWILSRTPVLER